VHHWQCYNETSMPTQVYCFHMNEVFTNRSDKDEIYPLTTEEIAEAHQADASLKHLFKCNAVIDQGLEIELIKNTTCVCKDGQLVIPKPLQVHAIKWYHHYLQHPGHTHLKEMMNAAMYWMRTTIRSLAKSYRSCQINKRWLQIPWYLEMDRPYPTSLTFTPTPLEVAKSSIIAPIIFSVFVITNTALLHTLKIE
jgi:hypothetical protein